MAISKQSQPEPQAGPVIDIGERQVSYWFPSITTNGETHACKHTRYGHETEAAARRCIKGVQWQLQQAAEVRADVAKQAEQPKEQSKPKVSAAARKLRSGSAGSTAAA
jgi:hypothetical protein